MTPWPAVTAASGRSLVRKQKALVKAAYKSLDETVRLTGGQRAPSLGQPGRGSGERA